jgi:hypothetical protein
MVELLVTTGASSAPVARVTGRARAARGVHPHGLLLHSDRVTDLGRLSSGTCTRFAR